MLLMLIAAGCVAASLAGARLGPSRVRWVAFAAVAVGLVVVLATRRAWENDVRRPVWIADAARGRWLERGVDWLLAALALTAAAALRAFGASPPRRAWLLAAAVGGASLAALAWGALGR
jgi:hypothetical protein